MQIALAPMEGLVDDILRDVLTQVGGIDWCVTEFIRVSDRALQPPAFLKLAPELARGAQTRAGVPLRVQLLGSDPTLLGESAAAACELGAPVIDLNFGCPAKTVNRSRGGAVLLNEPELLHSIVASVRRHTPAHIPVTAKMRLGYASSHGALECAQALESGGAAQLVVHARTKLDGYKPPAHWEWVARVQEVVKVPVYANGEIWTVDDWRRCREVCGVADVMLGRGLVSRPDLALQIRAFEAGEVLPPMSWQALLPLLQSFWRQAMHKLSPRYAPGRIKQWVAMLTRGYPEATALFDQLRRETDCQRIAALLGLEEQQPTNGLESREAISI
ncbi:tRNA-dihydrouridine synthase [Pseudomonas sp. NPDC007930]|uniref:tRNA dihydrouridine synthase n=1 Tax=Pseudomonas sp. NPDC007930 TaxID=3364417 RepID=UPI0036E8392E